MVDLVYCLRNLSFFDISLLYCYTNFNSSIICCLFSGDMYLSFGTSNSSFCKFLECSVEVFYKTLSFLSAISLIIKLPVASAVFLTALFEAVFIVSVIDFLPLRRSF